MQKQFVVKMIAAACAVFGSAAAMAAPPVIPQVVAGDRITLNSTPWGGANGGGEFLASTVPGYGNGPSFNTFCIEYSEHFSYGQQLKVAKVNTGSKNGGSGGGVADPAGGTWDPISWQTAYLFTNFSKGTLANYDYGTSGAHLTEHKADSQALQLAIWVLEDEISASVNSSVYTQYTALNDIGAEARAFVTAANTAVANHTWYGIGNVKALNLLRESSVGSGNFNTVAQDQLYLQPIPEPETYAMMLAGLGLIGFVAGRRRRKLM
jgi:hypothetical protein